VEEQDGAGGHQRGLRAGGRPDPHIVNNAYKWSSTGMLPDGGAFTDFLAKLNGEFDPGAATVCFAGDCDWQLPRISELQTTLIGPYAASGQAPTCSTAQCIDPRFAAVGGPTASSLYWSASTNAVNPAYAWNAFFLDGFVGNFFNLKTNDLYARAVRAGSSTCCVSIALIALPRRAGTVCVDGSHCGSLVRFKAQEPACRRLCDPRVAGARGGVRETMAWT